MLMNSWNNAATDGNSGMKQLEVPLLLLEWDGIHHPEHFVKFPKWSTGNLNSKGWRGKKFFCCCCCWRKQHNGGDKESNHWSTNIFTTMPPVHSKVDKRWHNRGVFLRFASGTRHLLGPWYTVHCIMCASVYLMFSISVAALIHVKSYSNTPS